MTESVPVTRYLRVRNFDTYQHYKKRRPPWIKLHAAVLDNYDIARLPDASKAHAFLIWVLASKLDNRIPYDAQWIEKRISATEHLNLQVLLSSGVLELVEDDASIALATRKQTAIPETETETETTSGQTALTERKNGKPHQLPDYPPEFEELWSVYPTRSGGNSKSEAFKQFRARLKGGDTPAQLIAGTRRYRGYCDATDKTGTEFVKQTRTFLGVARYYLETWDIPTKRNGASHRTNESIKRGYA